jgi:hypothetical protein
MSNALAFLGRDMAVDLGTASTLCMSAAGLFSMNLGVA